MCLMICGKSSSVRETLLSTPGLAANIFNRNSDGIGAMYTTSKGKLRTPKIVANNVAEFIAFIAQLPNDGRNIAVHARMKTHGDIDLTNCHPYPVIEGQVALMHNGILSQGNAADQTKSDTWHYINDVVRPMLEQAPKLFTNHAWRTLIENDIGNTRNRFAIMDNEGDLVILNRESGIEVQDMWFSNTYAWDPSFLLPDFRKPVAKTYSTGGHYIGGWQSRYFTDYEDYNDKAYPVPVVPTLRSEQTTIGPSDADLIMEEISDPQHMGFTDDDVFEAIKNSDVRDLADMIYDAPVYTLHCLFQTCKFEPFPEDDRVLKPDTMEQAVTKALVSEDTRELRRIAKFTPLGEERVAQVMCWLGDWVGKPINEKDNVIEMPHNVPSNVVPLTPRSQDMTEQARAEIQAELDSVMAGVREVVEESVVH